MSRPPFHIRAEYIEPNAKKLKIKKYEIDDHQGGKVSIWDWQSEEALQHSFGLLLAAYNLRPRLEQKIGDRYQRLDIALHPTDTKGASGSPVFFEMKKVLGTQAAYTIVGQVREYLRINSDYIAIAVVSRIDSENAAEILEREGIPLFCYPPQMHQRCYQDRAGMPAELAEMIRDKRYVNIQPTLLSTKSIASHVRPGFSIANCVKQFQREKENAA